MTLKISTQEDDQRQLAVKVEVDDKRFQQAMRKAAKSYARKLRIPGFRPGKAPYSIVIGYVGKEQLHQDVLQDMTPTIFKEALEQIDEQPVAQATLDDFEFDPFVLHLTVPLMPTIVLGDYREMRQEVNIVEVTDEAVDEAIDLTRRRQATTEPVERASAMGDNLVISVKGTVPAEEAEGTIFFDQEHYHLTLEKDAAFPNTDFAEQLVGWRVGEEVSFTVDFPIGYPHEALDGETARFDVSVQEVLERTVPELNDEFAKNQTGEFETFEDYRAAVSQHLQQQAEVQAKNDLIENLITEMLENVEELAYPQALVSAEIDDIIKGLKQEIAQAGWEWETYLEQRQMTEDSTRDEFEEGAVDRLERRLVLQKFIDLEQLALSEAEIDAAIDERLETFDEEMRELMRPYLVAEGGTVLRHEALMNKVYDRVVAIFAGDAPSLTGETTEEDEADTDDEPEVAEASDTIVEQSENGDE